MDRSVADKQGPMSWLVCLESVDLPRMSRVVRDKMMHIMLLTQHTIRNTPIETCLKVAVSSSPVENRTELSGCVQTFEPGSCFRSHFGSSLGRALARPGWLARATVIKEAMDDVWLLVVKGSLKHRIDILGVERPRHELTEAQRQLHEAAEKCHDEFPSWWEGSVDHKDCVFERPPWARGAFVYLTAEHAAGIQDAIEEGDLQLQSKHVLISDSLRPTLTRVMDEKPQESGREAFLKRRVTVEQESVVTLHPSYTFSELYRRRHPEGKRGDADARAGCDDGERLSRGKQDLLQVSADIMEQRELRNVDVELLEFLAAPPSVQRLQPEMWLDVWHLICEENDGWIEMQQDAAGDDCPYCNTCSCWADCSHLASKECEDKNELIGHAPGPLLAAVLQAQRRRDAKRGGFPAPAGGAAPSGGGGYGSEGHTILFTTRCTGCYALTCLSR